jgi:uncharacterized protein YecT (DUF1311 family)
MKIILAALSIALLSATAAQAIDCAKASTDLEHAICNSPDLLKADDALNAAYQSALKAVGPKMTKALKADAAGWAEYRYDNCAMDEAGDPSKPEDILSCLISDTQTRTAFLSGMPAAGPGFGEPMSPQVMTGADDIINEYLRFAAPKAPAAKAFNAALDKELKTVRMAKSTDHISDSFQLKLAYASPDLISANIDSDYEEGYAHPMVANYAINIDGKSGKVLTMADALDADGLKTVEANCAEQDKDYISVGEEGSDVRADNIKSMVDDLKFWTFGATSAKLEFAEYGDDTYPSCTLGYDVLKPLMKATFPLPQ